MCLARGSESQNRKSSSRQHRTSLRASMWVLVVTLMVCSVVGSGCLRTHKEIEIIRVSITPWPEEAQGAMWVATNKPIRVGVDGSDAVAEKDVGGYILIHKEDWKALIRALKKKAGKEE